MSHPRPAHSAAQGQATTLRRSTPSGSGAPSRCTTCAHLSEKEVRVGSGTDACKAAKILHSHAQRLALGSDQQPQGAVGFLGTTHSN